MNNIYRSKQVYRIIPLIFLVSLGCNSGNKLEFLGEIGVCTGIENAGMLAEKGFSYFEGSVGNILAPASSDEKFDSILNLIKASPLPVKSCNSFLPGNLKCVGPEPDHEELLRYMEIAFKRAELAGVEIIVFGSGRSRGIPDDFPREKAREQFIDLCSAMAPIAEKYGVTVVLEPLNKGEVNFINSVAEGGEIVREVNHPNFRLLADLFHMLRENEGPESIVQYGDLLRHIHIAENTDRAAPGTNKEDFTPYFEALKKIGYSGRMSIECRWNDLESESGTSLQYIKDQLLTISNK